MIVDINHEKKIIERAKENIEIAITNAMLAAFKEALGKKASDQFEEKLADLIRWEFL